MDELTRNNNVADARADQCRNPEGAPTGVTSASTPNPIPIDQAKQLIEAENQLKRCGYVRDADGAYQQTPEARRAEIAALDLDSFHFRNLVRAESKSIEIDTDTPALDRMSDEIESGLDAIGEKFGYNDLGDLLRWGTDVLSDIDAALTEHMTSAEQIAEDAAEREKEFGPSAWPDDSRPADLKIVGGVA